MHDSTRGEPPPCYVFDASSLIDLERSNRLSELPAVPGDWILVGTLVAIEVNQPRSKLKAWLARGRPKSSTVDEDRLSERLLLQVQPRIHPADAQAISIAYHRKGTLVMEDRAARNRARGLDIRCLHCQEFLDEVRPRLPL